MSKKEVTEVKKELPAEMLADWNDSSELDQSDILIPKILLMQGPSKMVAAGKCKFGEIVDSVSEKILGSAIEGQVKPVMIIPIMQFKTWVHNEKVGEKFQLRGVEPATAANADTPLKDYEKNGSIWRSDRTQNFFVLVVEGGKIGALPHLLSFRRTSYRTGQKLYTHFYESKTANKPPASTTFALSGRKRENSDGQPYYIFEMKPEGETSMELVGQAYTWLKRLKENKHKVDNRDLTDDEVTAPGTEEAEY